MKRLCPEVVQSSAMDCGPACLKALLEGHGIHASYGRLREACQTDVDGTSIDSLEDVAVRLGLAAEQVVIPADHLFAEGVPTLPAIAVVRLPGGLTHFVVAWRLHGGLVQVMDPAVGRRFMRRDAFLADLHQHSMRVPAADWRSYAADAQFLAACRARARQLGVSSIDTLIASALADEGWHGLATLDAVLRFAGTLAASGGLARGAEADRVVAALFASEREHPGEGHVPGRFWSARPSEPDDEGNEQLVLTGAVLVRVNGLGEAQPEALPAELRAALAEPAPRPLAWVWGALGEEGRLLPTLLALAVLVSAGLTVAEGLLFRGLLEVGGLLQSHGERVLAGVGLVVALLLGLGLDLAWTRGLLDLGRRLEIRLRTRFLAKLTRLPDRYFASRLSSDMAARAHRLQLLHELPLLLGRLARDGLHMLAITLAIAWLYPGALGLTLAVLAVSLVMPLLGLPLLDERDLRARTQLGGLLTLHIDAMRGGIAIKSHGAERVIAAEHEERLVAWARAARRLWRAALTLDALTVITATLLTLLLVAREVAAGGSLAPLLLLAYWALSLPQLGRSLARGVARLPELRNEIVRFLEPLGAAEEELGETVPHAADQRGVALAFSEVDLVAAGQPILKQISLVISPGEQVAIVGRSGSGKSSLLGLLLGWHRPAAGMLLADDAPLDAPALRAQTAWIDPAVQLWNRSLVDNVRYGAPGPHVAQAMDDAELATVLPRLPDGMLTPLGEDGLTVSGGEGQRVRAARALVRDQARLVLLDEAFRGLEHEVRHRLLERARVRWAGATMLCVTHDIGEAVRFDRVIVLDGGRIVEDGSPRELLATADGHLRRMLDEEEALAQYLDRQFTALRLEARP